MIWVGGGDGAWQSAVRSKAICSDDGLSIHFAHSTTVFRCALIDRSDSLGCLGGVGQCLAPPPCSSFFSQRRHSRIDIQHRHTVRISIITDFNLRVGSAVPTLVAYRAETAGRVADQLDGPSSLAENSIAEERPLSAAWARECECDGCCCCSCVR